MIKNSISILGCGWLGLPLAERLVQNGFRVKGSTTSPQKGEALSKVGIEPYVLESVPPLNGERVKDFFQSPILFLNIPFRRRMTDPHLYQQQIQVVVKEAIKGEVEWIIFASSTSIYPEHCLDAREDADFTPDNERSQVLLDVENDLRQASLDVTIIRFAGLYGGDRLIGNFLRREAAPKPGNIPVNLIHRDDCIGIISGIIKKGITNEVVNACSDGHPSRRELYTLAATRLGLKPPVFLDDNGTGSGKIVANQKIKDLLGYQFKHSNPLDALT